MSSKATILATLFAATLVTLMSLPLATAASVERDVGNHVLDYGPTCTATVQDPNYPWFVTVNDTLTWYIDISGETDYGGTLYNWFNLSISITVSEEYYWSDNVTENITVNNGRPIEESTRIEVIWVPDEADLYTVEWDSTMKFVADNQGPTCDDTMFGGHSVSVSE